MHYHHYESAPREIRWNHRYNSSTERRKTNFMEIYLPVCLGIMSYDPINKSELMIMHVKSHYWWLSDWLLSEHQAYEISQLQVVVINFFFIQALLNFMCCVLLVWSVHLFIARCTLLMKNATFTTPRRSHVSWWLCFLLLSVGSITSYAPIVGEAREMDGRKKEIQTDRKKAATNVINSFSVYYNFALDVLSVAHIISHMKSSNWWPLPVSFT